MKRIWASVVLIAIVIALCVTENIYIKKTCDKSLGYLEKMETQYNLKDYNGTALTAKELENHWVAAEKFLSRFVSSETLNDIGSSIAELTELAKQENDEFLPHIRDSQVMIYHFLKSERYTVY